ncbi:sugar ABC transporter substrate-binding protein [[Clostridium] hylemonae]|uniref:sugar ABC transporter substrate-binding protein n=1 Tax=[Clostridium] hylemonae TaxID=89153 RepID=UPI001D07544D|nr:sugar ABC transporter substrate-binding protein [[Clostridium] hylemonae]MCB7522661.1 sugar ABC transporter substrate-binding protein [[Clostridium] hylemonae]
MSKRLKSTAILLVIVSMLVCACSSGGGKADTEKTEKKTEDSGNKDKITVGATLSDFTISFQAAMYNELLDAQKEYDNIEFILQDGASDSALQVNQIETFITQGVDAILINAVSDAVEPSLKRAMEAGIPVFAVNRSITDENAYSYFIGANDTLSGEQMANCLLDMIEKDQMDSCNILYIQGVIGATYQTLRQGGFDSIMDEKGYDMGVNILERIPCKHDKETVISSIQNMLNKYPAGEIDAIVCEGPDDAVGALQAVQSAGRTELVGKIVGMDMPTEVWDAIKAGKIYGTVLQDPAEQCEVGIKTIETYFFGDKDSLKEKFIETDLPMVTSENVNDVTPSW